MCVGVCIYARTRVCVCAFVCVRKRIFEFMWYEIKKKLSNTNSDTLSNRDVCPISK